MVVPSPGLAEVYADFHNHSCLSPCAELSMSPSAMARKAREKDIGIFALTDHNASLNTPAFALACAREGVIPLFGLELNPLEEAHILAIFPNPRWALEFGKSIEGLLPDIPWTAERFGDQPVVDSGENILQCYPKWLGAALDIGFDELARRARDAGAIVIPAHVDRGAFSVSSQLGFLPEGPYSAVEALGKPSMALIGGYAVIRGSDAHDPDQIGCRRFRLALPQMIVGEMISALQEYSSRIELATEGFGDGGYADLLKRPETRLYPEGEAEALFAAVRTALETGTISLHP